MTDPQSVSWQLSGFGDEIDADARIRVAVLQALGANHIDVRSAWGTNSVHHNSIWQHEHERQRKTVLVGGRRKPRPDECSAHLHVRLIA